MATTYSSRYYNSDGTVKTPAPSSSSLGVQMAPINETIATTVIDAAGDRHFLFPIPVAGMREFIGTWLSSGDMDTGGPTLDADLVFIYTVAGVEQTPVVIYDSSVSGLFSAALAMKWVELKLSLSAYKTADNGYVNVVFLTNTAATTPAAVNLTLIPFYQ